MRYDNNFRVVSQTINDVDSIQYTYDNDGLLTQSGDLQITRDSSNGRVMSTQVGNTTTDYAYSNTGELASVDNSVNGSSIYSTNYTRDSLGRISTLTEIIEGTTTTKRYTYDIAGRLREVYNNNLLTSKYYYDANGNRDSVVTPSGTTNGIYDAQDRMLQYGKSNYIYTRNGELNLKIEGTDTTKYVYDDFGNLVSVTLPNQTKIEYIIDGQNRRIGRKVNGVVTNRWLYVGQLHPVAEVDSAGNIVATYHTSYMKHGDTLYSIVRDHFGSVRMVMNVETGKIMQRIDYDEWGNVLLDSNPGFQPFGYASGLYDTQTKFVRFGARDYDCNVGRWVSKDPVGFKGKATNLYQYCKNNPINYSDPNGLWTFSIGVSVDIEIGPITWSGSAGIAIDDEGNVGLYSGGGAGVSVGAKAAGGVNIMMSDAEDINDLKGPFNNVSAGLGDGLSISGNAFMGESSCHGLDTGVGVTIGPGLGAGGGTSVTGTNVSPIGKLWGN